MLNEDKVEKCSMFKEIVTGDDFRIYFWPVVCLLVFHWALEVIYSPMELGSRSQREEYYLFFTMVLNLLMLWTLVRRYREVKGWPVHTSVRVLLIIFTAVMGLGMISQAYTLITSAANYTAVGGV